MKLDRADPTLEPRPAQGRGYDRRRFLQVALATGMAAFSVPALGRVARGVGTPPPASVPSLLHVGDPIAALAASLDYDRGRIFRFVADEIMFEPYEGILRGDVGTLRARAGNSVDQALLLASLLDAAKIPIRFAMGTLAASAERTLLAGAQLDLAEIRHLAAQVIVGDAREALEAAPEVFPSLSPGSQTSRSEASAMAQRVHDTASSLVDASVASISAALGGAGITLPASTDPTLPTSERVLHHWVQAAFGSEWQDLDPSFPGSDPGTAMTSAATTLEALPDDLHHQVQFVVVRESVSGGRLVQQTILDSTRSAASLSGMPISFLHLDPSGLQALGGNIAGSIAGTLTHHPVLVLGATVVSADEPVTFGAEEGVDSAFGGSANGEGEATAEWLEVRVLSPGADVTTSRRSIFDRIGDEVRASGTFDLSALAPVQLVDRPDGAGKAYLPCLATTSFAVTGGNINGAWILEDVPGRDSEVGGLSVLANLYPMMLHGLGADIAAAAGVRMFLDGPLVVSYGLRPLDIVGPDALTEIAYDLWHRNIGTLPVAGTAATAPPGVVAGVVSHVAERMAMGAWTAAEEADSNASIGVARIFEAAARSGVPLVVLRDGVPAGSGYPEPARQRMADALAMGDLVVIPARSVEVGGAQRVGWWQVDPASGRARDQMDDGRAVEFTEEGTLWSKIMRVATCFLWIGASALVVGRFVAYLLGKSTDGLSETSGLLAVLGGVARTQYTIPKLPQEFRPPPGTKLC